MTPVQLSHALAKATIRWADIVRAVSEAPLGPERDALKAAALDAGQQVRLARASYLATCPPDPWSGATRQPNP